MDREKTGALIATARKERGLTQIDAACVELKYSDDSMIAINCTAVEDEVANSRFQRSELDWLIYNDPLSYAELILNGDPEEYLRNVAGSHELED